MMRRTVAFYVALIMLMVTHELRAGKNTAVDGTALPKVLNLSIQVTTPLKPQEYIDGFHFNASEVKWLLNPHWVHGKKKSLSQKIGVDCKTLRRLMTKDVTRNKAITQLNAKLSQGEAIWSKFSYAIQQWMIIAELQKQFTTEALSKVTSFPLDQLVHFLHSPNEPIPTAFFSRLSKAHRNTLLVGSPTSSQVVRQAPPILTATFDLKPAAGYGIFSRPQAILQLASETRFLCEEPGSDATCKMDPLLCGLQLKHLELMQEGGVYIPKNPSVSQQRASSLIHGLPQDALPLTAAGALYIDSSTGKSLHKLPQFDRQPYVSVYSDGLSPPNFVSKPLAALTESRATCRPKGHTYSGGRRYPAPIKEEYTYKHTLPGGHEIKFDRGHGCDHADTLEHDGLLSTYDPDNFVPQNEYYNQMIRNHLVGKIRREGGEYKEFSIYHPTPLLTDGIPIPELFIFIELYGGKAHAAYVFPNFVPYASLHFEKPLSSNYLNYCQLYQADAVLDYFYTPLVQARNPVPHMHQRDKGWIHAHEVYLGVYKMFNNMTEHAFPPRARSTLIQVIMNRAIHTAAVLDFTGLSSLEMAVNHFSNERIYWELDDRCLEEWDQEFEASFSQLSKALRDAYGHFMSLYSDSLQDDTLKREVTKLAFGGIVHLFDGTNRFHIRKILGGRKTFDLDVAKKYLRVALQKIHGGSFSQRDVEGIIYILTRTESLEDYEMAKSLFAMSSSDSPSSSGEDILLMAFPDDLDPLFEFSLKLRCLLLEATLDSAIEMIQSSKIETEVIFEAFQILHGSPQLENYRGFTSRKFYRLLESLEISETSMSLKKRIGDFLFKAKYNDHHVWVKKIITHFFMHPSFDNGRLLSHWLRTGSGCIKKNIQGAWDITCMITYGSIITFGNTDDSE